MTVITVIHVFFALVLIGIVLLQQGKGADMGASFGGGSSNTVFGASGADNFLVKVTTLCAVVFMGTSIALAVMARLPQQNEGRLFRDAPEVTTVQDLPKPADTNSPAALPATAGPDSAAPASANAAASVPAAVNNSSAPVSANAPATAGAVAVDPNAASAPQAPALPSEKKGE